MFLLEGFFPPYSLDFSVLSISLEQYTFPAPLNIGLVI